MIAPCLSKCQICYTNILHIFESSNFMFMLLLYTQCTDMSKKWYKLMFWKYVADILHLLFPSTQSLMYLCDRNNIPIKKVRRKWNFLLFFIILLKCRVFFLNVFNSLIKQPKGNLFNEIIFEVFSPFLYLWSSNLMVWKIRFFFLLFNLSH